MAKIRKVERLAVVLPDGTKSDIDNALVKKYALTAGSRTPFSGNPTATVTRIIEQKRGPKEWTAEEDEYLLSHWETTTKEMLENHLLVTTTTLTKRHKQLVAEQKAKEKPAKKTSRTKKTTKASSGKTKTKTKTKSKKT